MIPGESSSCELASTAHGRTLLDRLADVLRSETAREHYPSLLCRCARVMPGILLLPRQVEHVGDRLVAAQEHGIAAAVSVLALVELDEVGAGVGPLADEDRDREHRLGDRQDALRAPRALAGEDEPGEVGARLGGDGHVLLARQPADLDERPVDQLAELRRRIRSRA